MTIRVPAVSVSSGLAYPPAAYESRLLAPAAGTTRHADIDGRAAACAPLTIAFAYFIFTRA